MFQSTREWFKRNRTRFAVGAGVIGGAYMAGQYALGKINEARQHMSDDRIAKENLRRRFSQNQEDCTYTVLALLPTATENILHALPVEDITRELQARKSEKLSRSVASSELAPSDKASTNGDSVAGSGFVHASQALAAPGDDAAAPPATATASATASKSKLQLWDELKILSLTRALTLLYALALLTLLTRIQLNLLGRRNYLSSVISLASPSNPGRIHLEDRDDPDAAEHGDDFDTNRKYLTFSWWLLHRGWQDLRARVEAAVADVFGSLAPRDSLTFAQLSALLLQVRRRVEGATPAERKAAQWLPFLLPPRDQEATVLAESGVLRPASPPALATAPPADDDPITPPLRRLLDETADLVESPTANHVLTLLLDAAFGHLVDARIADEAFKIPAPALALTPSLPDPLVGRITELPDNDASPADPRDTSAKLATVLAAVTRQAHALGAGALVDEDGGQGAEVFKEANEYLNVMEGVRDLEAFAAVVYSSNFEHEALGLNGGGGGGAEGLESRPLTREGGGGGDEGAGGFEGAWKTAVRAGGK